MTSTLSDDLEYWHALQLSQTTQYKEDIILSECRHSLKRASTVIDIGCGRSDFSWRIADAMGADQLVRLDAHCAPEVRARGSTPLEVVDLFETVPLSRPRSSEKFDIILCLDVLHEVYSFASRARGDHRVVDRRTGMSAVSQTLGQCREMLGPEGMLIISDAILPDHNRSIVVETADESVADSVRYLERDYRAATLNLRWLGRHVFECDSATMCIVLTQYNKILTGDIRRWNIEKDELHQYISSSGFIGVAKSLGLTCRVTIGTPESVRGTYEEHFMVVSGVLPDTRGIAFMQRHSLSED